MLVSEWVYLTWAVWSDGVWCELTKRVCFYMIVTIYLLPYTLRYIVVTWVIYQWVIQAVWVYISIVNRKMNYCLNYEIIHLMLRKSCKYVHWLSHGKNRCNWFWGNIFWTCLWNEKCEYMCSRKSEVLLPPKAKKLKLNYIYVSMSLLETNNILEPFYILISYVHTWHFLLSFYFNEIVIFKITSKNTLKIMIILQIKWIIIWWQISNL